MEGDTRRLDGFGIFVKDMATMVRFYRDVLNFEIQEDGNASNVYWVKDGTLFLLYRRTDFEKMTNSTFGYMKSMGIMKLPSASITMRRLI